MHSSLTSDLLHQLTNDRSQDLQASAAARRLVAGDPVRSRFARFLRRAADRIDSAAATPGPVGINSSPDAPGRVRGVSMLREEGLDERLRAA